MRNEPLYDGKRGLEIYLAVNEYGKTYKDLTKYYGVSYSRICQLYNRTSRYIINGMKRTNYNYEFYKEWLIGYYKPDMDKFKLGIEDFLDMEMEDF